MMNKKWIYLIGLMSIILMAFFIRYPHTPHQRLFDSTHYHLETNLIIQNGRAIWNLSPLTIFGIYPIIGAGLMGSHYFLGSVTITTGFNIESSIYIMNLGITTFMILSSFILGKKIFGSNNMGLLLAFFFSTARTIVIYQDWTATPRGFFPAFLPIIIFSMFSIYYKSNGNYKINKKYLILFITFVLAMSSVHRAIALAFPGLVLFFLYNRYHVKIRYIIMDINKPLFDEDKMYKIYKLIFMHIFFYLCIVLSVIFFADFFGDPEFLRRTVIIKSDNPFLQGINMLYYISRKYGLSIIFTALGFIILSIKSKNRYEAFFLLAILALIPFSVQEAYIFPIWAIYLSILSCYGFLWFIKNVKTSFTTSVLVSAIILTTIVVAPIYVTISEPHHVERRGLTYVTEQEYETSLVIPNFIDEDASFYVDPHFNNFILSAYSYRCSLGLRGIEQVWINESIKDEYVIESIFDTHIGYTLENIYNEKGMLFYITNDPLIPDRNILKGWRAMGHYNLIPMMYKHEWYYTIVDYYNIQIMIIDETNAPDSNYISQLSNTEYSLYQNGRYNFYPVSY